MRLLLDTHVLLWSMAEPRRLARPTRQAITDPANDIFVSAAAIWEISIKAGLGRLRVPDDLLPTLDRMNIGRLDITAGHAWAVRDLPALHADPFDRIQVAQARVEGLTIVTADPAIRRYDVVTIKA